MPQNLDKDGLRSKINSYELFFIDIWGVIHNGLQIFEDSIEVLENLKKNKKDFVLLTNAPRPNTTVIEFLKKMGLKKDDVLEPFRGLFWGPGRASGGHPGLSGGALFLDPFFDPSWGRQKPKKMDFGPYVLHISKGRCKSKYQKKIPKLGPNI